MNDHSLMNNILFQFSISRQLLEYHLATLEQEEYLWHLPNSTLYLKQAEGTWYTELPETEAYDIGPPSIAWTLWHITYWWEMVLDHSFGTGTLTKDDVPVTGDVSEIKARISALTETWEKKLAALSDEELHSKQRTAFPFNNEVPFHQLASWLNLELMKNASEVGAARFQYAALK